MKPKVKIKSSEILSDRQYILKNVSYEYQRRDGSRQQFRLPTFLNGNETGLLIEACAGMLDGNDPEECARREAEEETGYKISKVKKVFEMYMSPGAVTEIIYFFIAEYSPEMKVSSGGGISKEQEDIEVLELPYEKAMQMIDLGEIKDAKTVILLQYLQLNQLL